MCVCVFVCERETVCVYANAREARKSGTIKNENIKNASGIKTSDDFVKSPICREKERKKIYNLLNQLEMKDTYILKYLMGKIEML